MTTPRTSRNALFRLLEHVDQPIYLLDRQRRIVYCNPATADWLQCDAQQLTSVRCDYHSGQGNALLDKAAGLCPPAEVFAGQPMQGTITSRSEEGKLQVRQAWFCPLAEAGQTNGVLVVGLDPPGAERGSHSGYDPQRLHLTLQQLRAEMRGQVDLDRLLGVSSSARQVRRQVQVAIDARADTLIVGPKGSGREHLARSIHYASPSEQIGPLIPIHADMADAETVQTTIKDLFRPHRQGETPGRLLLLEVDRFSEMAQIELREFFKLPDFRISLLATSRTRLIELSRAGEFDPELAHWLSTLVIELPQLAQRREDIPLLAQLFLEDSNRRGETQRSGFTAAAMTALQQYDWPENLDQLHLVVQRACATSSNSKIDFADLPVEIRSAAHAEQFARTPLRTIQLETMLGEIERELIQRAVRQAKGNKSQAAKLLGISRARLLRRMEKLDES